MLHQTATAHARPEGAPVRPPIDVLVVDDSAVIRGLVTRILEAEPDIAVSATAANGLLAIREVQRHAFDVVVLDIEMPVMDGLTAIPRLLEADPGLNILIASTLSTRNAEISLEALHAGAADYLPKPTSSKDIVSGSSGVGGFRSELVDKVRGLGEAARARRGTEPVALAPTPAEAPAREPAKPTAPVKHLHVPAVPMALRPESGQPPRILAIGSSTGGPQALLSVLGALGPDFPLPVLITQHMPATFTPILATHIASRTGLACTEAEQGEPIRPNHVYLARGDHHLLVAASGTQRVLVVDDGPAENFCRPAVDPMFRSLAKAFGASVLAAVLTGMGADGAKGGQAIVDAGGTIIAQDEETSVVWGMPGAAAAAGLCSAVLPLDAIAPWITERVGRAGQ